MYLWSKYLLIQLSYIHITVSYPSSLLSFCLSCPFRTFHPNCLCTHHPSTHPSTHLTGMYWIVTMNHTLDPGGTVTSSPWHLPYSLVKASVQTVTTNALPPKRGCWGSVRRLISCHEVLWKKWCLRLEVKNMWNLSNTGGSWAEKVNIFCRIVIQA